MVVQQVRHQTGDSYSWVWLSVSHCCTATFGKLFTRLCFCCHAVWFGISQMAATTCGWEDNWWLAESISTLPLGIWLSSCDDDDDDDDVQADCQVSAISWCHACTTPNYSKYLLKFRETILTL